MTMTMTIQSMMRASKMYVIISHAWFLTMTMTMHQAGIIKDMGARLALERQRAHYRGRQGVVGLEGLLQGVLDLSPHGGRATRCGAA